MNTNKQTDRPETLEYAVLGRRVQLIGNWLRGLL